MKVTQYMTAGDVHLRPFSLRPMGTEMSGIYTLRLSGEKRKEENKNYRFNFRGTLSTSVPLLILSNQKL